MVGNGFIVKLIAKRDARLSLRVPRELLREVESFLAAQKWSRPDAIIYLLYVGLDTVRKQQSSK